ncbi:hypothetical protein CHS0354_017958 [Potamilus streckersoni]|uniref:Death domain-containing protein n=1 Tax=Potamilus streckersoni TaxID=2493646 RepID=A0AAE0VJK3_9BIVA|nr:hypothetical protein CHS0354_017958 [Potamilus streckersoni]
MESVGETIMEPNGVEQYSTETTQMEKMINTTHMEISNNNTPQSNLCLNGDVSKPNGEEDNILEKVKKDVVSDTWEGENSPLSLTDNESKNTDEKKNVHAEERPSNECGQTNEKEQVVTDNDGHKTKTYGDAVRNDGEKQVETVKMDDSVKQTGSEEGKYDKKMMIENREVEAASNTDEHSEKEKEQVTTDETNSKPYKLHEGEEHVSTNSNESNEKMDDSVKQSCSEEGTSDKTMMIESGECEAASKIDDNSEKEKEQIIIHATNSKPYKLHEGEEHESKNSNESNEKMDDSVKQSGSEEGTSDKTMMIESGECEAASKIADNSEKGNEQITPDETNSKSYKLHEGEDNKTKNDSNATGEINANPENQPETTFEKTKEDPSLQENIFSMKPHINENMDASYISLNNEAEKTTTGYTINGVKIDEKVDEVGEKTIASLEQKYDESVEKQEHYQKEIDTNEDTRSNERNENHSKPLQDIGSRDNNGQKEELNGESYKNEVHQDSGDEEKELKVTERSQEDSLHTPGISKSEDYGDTSVSIEKGTFEGREQSYPEHTLINSDHGEKLIKNIGKENEVWTESNGNLTKITEEKDNEEIIKTETTETIEIQPVTEVKEVDTPNKGLESREDGVENVLNMKKENHDREQDAQIFNQNEPEQIRMEKERDVAVEDDTFDKPRNLYDNEVSDFKTIVAEHKKNGNHKLEEDKTEQNNAQVIPKNDDQNQSKAPDNNLKMVKTVHVENISHDVKAEDNKKKKVRISEPLTPAERARDIQTDSATPKPLPKNLQARIENAERGESKRFMEEGGAMKVEITESDGGSEGEERKAVLTESVIGSKGGQKDLNQSLSEVILEPEEAKPEEQPESEPENVLLKILLEKNVEIDGHVDSISELESGVTKLLESIKQVTNHYKQRLDLQHLKDFTADLGKFHGDFTSINKAYEKCDTLCTNIGLTLKELRGLTETIRTKIDWKFETEDLSTWVDITPEHESEKIQLKEEAVAAQRIASKRAADARAAVAKTVSGIAQAQELVARTEADAAEAEIEAKRARADAKAALKAVEEARIAAEEKRKVEEISREKAEEKARQIAAEDRKKKEDEEKRIAEAARAKGTSLANERKQFAEETARTEKERKNPKNWPRYIYSIEGSGDFDNGIGCVIRVMEGSMKKDYVECTRINQLTGVLEMLDNEELISNIIEVKQSSPDKKIKFEEPMAIAIPCCLNRVPFGREAFIKTFTSGTWKELPANDVLFEDIKETKLIETRTKSFGLFAVVLRNKRDTLIFNRNGNKVSASSDSRISFTCKPGTFKVNTIFHLEYLSVDMAAISDLKHRRPKECECVISSSPIVRFSITSKACKKPIQVTLPLPPAATRPKRPSTTGTPRGGDPKDVEKLPVSERPLTSFAPTKEDEPEECFYLLQHDASNGWTKAKTQDVTFIKNKDIVMFEMEEPFERFLVLRLKQGARETTSEKIAGFLETSLLQRNVQVFLRQRHDDPNTVVVSCATSSRVEAALQALAKDGFVEGPPPSTDLILKEGQIMEIGFRGNIHCSCDNKELKFVFNSHIISKCAFEVQENDKFAQKSFDSYRGFAKITTKSLVPRPPQTQPKPGDKVEMVEAEILLAELLISIPKPEPEPPKPLPTAPVKLSAIGPITSNVLLHVAQELGDEWKRLAQSLSLRPVRIQAILRQNVHNENVQTRYDMLMAWAKRQPRSTDKSALLCLALAAAGRNDLAEEIRDKSEDFRQQQIIVSRSTRLRQAFIKVAKTLAVVNEWKELALSLGLSADDIRVVNEKAASCQEKCYITLEMWKDKQGENASITELASVLKKSRFDVLSREIEALIS